MAALLSDLSSFKRPSAARPILTSAFFLVSVAAGFVFAGCFVSVVFLLHPANNEANMKTAAVIVIILFLFM
ncbi:MAG: hypothetical protein LIR50_08370 [Bacillota bacterium]|nr:hypothetical protein [Bacillota bacterium]